MLKRLISRITSFSVWSSAILLLLALACVWVNPWKIPFAGLVTLATAPLIVLNIILLVYAMIRGKRAGWLTLIALILSVPQIFNLWGFHISARQQDDTETLKLMTYNVRVFDLYEWSHNDASREAIFETLEGIAPDIICFQEFYSQPGGSWDNIQVCRNQLEFPHYYFSQELILDKGRQWGIATFSRYPIVKAEEIMQAPTANSRGLRPYKGIYTDIDIGPDTIRLINIHLASVYLHQEDYATLENLKGQQEFSLKRSSSIIGKLRRGYKKRGYQVKQLEQFLEETDQPHPVVIAGDFNDVPTSFAYNRLSRNFRDAWTAVSWGPGATYNGPVPGLRIDQILVDKSLEVRNSKIIDSKISDHAPLMTEIVIDKQNATE